MNKETVIKFGALFLKAVAIIGIAATGVEIVRKHWNPNKTLLPNLRATVPALLALAYAANKGTR